VKIDLSYNSFDGNAGNQTFRITSTTSAALRATYPNEVAEATALKYNNISGLDRYARSTNDVYIAAVTVDLADNVQLTAHYGHFDLTVEQATDFVPLGVISSRTFSAVNSKQDSGEVRLAADLFDDRLALQGGLYYLKEKGDTIVRSQSLPASLGGNGVIAIPFNTGENRSKAAFAQGTFALTDQLKLTLGGRFTDERRSVTNNTQIIPLATITPGNPGGMSICALAQPAQDPRAADLLIGPCLYGKTINNSYFSYLASVDYKPGPDHLVYVKTARGYRAGGTSPRGANPDAFKEFFPEKVTEYEVGYKGRLFDRLNLNVALYLDQRRNGQASGIILGAGGNAVTTIVNRVNEDIFGQEIEASLKLADFLTIDGNFTHQDKRIPYVSKTRYGIGATVRAPVASGTLKGRLDYSWQSSLDTMPLGCTASGDVRKVCPSYNRNINTTDSYGLFNGKITYEFDEPNLQISLYGRNLTDKYYDTWKPDSRTSGMTQAYVGAPRTYGIELRYQY
jgi:iron complex outermembrane receptor protein